MIQTLRSTIVAPCPMERIINMPKLKDINEAGVSILNEVIGARVREVRKAQGLTQKELAEKTGITGVYLSTLESGKRRWSADRLSDIALALNVSPALLQDPTISISRLSIVSKIIEKLVDVPEDKLGTVELVLEGFRD